MALFDPDRYDLMQQSPQLHNILAIDDHWREGQGQVGGLIRKSYQQHLHATSLGSSVRSLAGLPMGQMRQLDQQLYALIAVAGLVNDLASYEDVRDLKWEQDNKNLLTESGPSSVERLQARQEAQAIEKQIQARPKPTNITFPDLMLAKNNAEKKIERCLDLLEFRQLRTRYPLQGLIKANDRHCPKTDNRRVVHHYVSFEKLYFTEDGVNEWFREAIPACRLVETELYRAIGTITGRERSEHVRKDFPDAQLRKYCRETLKPAVRTLADDAISSLQSLQKHVETMAPPVAADLVEARHIFDMYKAHSTAATVPDHSTAGLMRMLDRMRGIGNRG